MAQKPKVDPHVGRLGYLQALVTEFQETESQDAKEQVLANLANFAYDPGNYQYLRQLQVLDLFLDSLSEENETLVKFAIGRCCFYHATLGTFSASGTSSPDAHLHGLAEGVFARHL
ncbi:armadillo repeat-containing protein 7 isoform X2 [Peromyscus maniculatus bairdii]|uniref:armadillo repeat-containing protein 7 isoform X2 n=1 Tax=Peromyscus maniculatus bairdii TaxID=230844 RepID=UPI001C2E796E|nr:armadillo repeat-containing protein 7 isoform X2 [Peromyscus maniculatus bairdii]